MNPKGFCLRAAVVCLLTCIRHTAKLQFYRCSEKSSEEWLLEGKKNLIGSSGIMTPHATTSSLLCSKKKTFTCSRFFTFNEPDLTHINSTSFYGLIVQSKRTTLQKIRLKLHKSITKAMHFTPSHATVLIRRFEGSFRATELPLLLLQQLSFKLFRMELARTLGISIFLLLADS